MDSSGAFELCELESGGLTRSYLRYVPQGIDPDTPVPLLISLHAAMQDPQTQMTWFPFDRLADEEGFMIVAPAAVDGFWNLDVTDEQYCDLARMSHVCGMIDPFTDQVVEPPPPDCRPAGEEEPVGAPPDDLAFLGELIDTTEWDYSIDADRVYIAGASWGGWMAARAACTAGGRFASVAALTNTLWLVPGCEAPEPMPVIGIGGTDDVYHPLCMAEAYGAAWAEHNGCRSGGAEEALGEGVVRVVYSDCNDDAAVVVYGADGLWTYPDMGVPEGLEPLTIIWEFFRRHPAS
jgi:polyhydroxybutyrate depolymerase